MISLTGHMRVDACPEPIDFRSGMNRLIGLVRERTDEEPMSGALFAFVNRKMTEIKLILYDGTGYFVGHKRLSCGRLKFWPKYPLGRVNSGIKVDPRELLLILCGDDPRGVISDPWKRIDGQGKEQREQDNPCGGGP